ncbi:glycogen debranching N-terminal domain-containing protein [Actinokineospora guangxiensis]|uniref:Glycogen debranching N-terminal domain-containing protein n=1 Tax=Actinokineospora guangxiensis TaxID=1490288 RepID=A0ABW0F0C1_9PSEU
MPSLQPLLHDLATAVAAPTVALGSRSGQIRPEGTQGVLHGDVRVLRSAVLTVDGVEPEAVSHTERGPGTSEFVAVHRRGVPGDGADPLVWLRRERTVTATGLRERFTLVSAAPVELDLDVRLLVDADFAPVEVIKSGRAAPPPVPVTVDAGVATWSARGLRGRVRAPGSRMDSDGTRLRVDWTAALPARGSASLEWELVVHDPGSPLTATSARLPELAVTADDPRLARLLERSMSDLAGLLVSEAGHPDDAFAAAGAPWFLTLFGRDSLWAARMLLPVSVDLAAGTLRTLARAQGTRHDPQTGEAPGKMPHERRRGEFVTGDLALPALYYGTIDATALWVCLLHDAWRWGMPEDQVRALLPALRAALRWITTDADPDGDGFAEYQDHTGRGLANQGWKDSGDAIRSADGAFADAPVALAEVQGYHHEALTKAAALLSALGHPDDAEPLTAAASSLAAAFRARFWVGDGTGPYPALALDAHKKPVDSLTSNIGHLLGSGLLTADESATIAARLLAPDMSSGFGLRTMSTTNDAYHPLSYHCGSVWPHDTAIVIAGLTAADHPTHATGLATQLLAAAEHFDWRLPELYGGFAAQDTARPVPYPAACRPQAWSAAGAVTILCTVLGLAVDVPGRTITVRPPRPGPVGGIRVSGLSVAGSPLTVRVDRSGVVTVEQCPPGFRVIT